MSHPGQIYNNPGYDAYNNNHNNNYNSGPGGGYGNDLEQQRQHDQYSPSIYSNHLAQQQQPQQQDAYAHYDEYQAPEPQWETKSYMSGNSSQVHLDPYGHQQPFEAPPVPPLPYGGYPPANNGGDYNRPNAGRPGMYRGDTAASAGYNVAKDKLMKRRSVRQVEVQEGNLVFDIPVPQHILGGAEYRTDKSSEEFTKMRYTAATCDPDQFMSSRYSLRPFLYGRRTEIFIVMTMYNEDDVLFLRTMNSVIKNIAHLCSRGRSKTWGNDGWQKVVVCIVSDGRSKVNKRTLQVLALMGCYQEGIAKDSVAGQDVTAHIFEYTSQVIVSETGEVGRGSCPVQLIFCLKEQNKKKLNSHRWFFNAFGPLIQPNVCVLLDVGTKPTSTSIYELWKCFDKHPHVGGACGEICVDTGRACSLLLTSPLAASQNFEYKMSNILDKPLESVFGYISVLPGAFSAYRYKALQNGRNGKGPLASYFKGETMHGGGATGAGLFERNMYLAEDRILCFEIVTKKEEAWTLKYVKSAKASTDVPTTVAEFISQRRRWLNGSLFAAIHATFHTHRIWSSGHGFLRKIVLQIEFIYNAIQLFFTWTSLANFYLAFFFLVSSATTPNSNAFNFLADGAAIGTQVFEIIVKLYIALIFIILVCSLGNRPQGSKWTYVMCIFLFGICQIITLWCAGYTVYLAVPHTLSGWEHIIPLIKSNTTFREIAISIMGTYGLYLIASIMHLEPWHMLTSFLQYMFLLPSYVNILMMYAMCNLHDVSWGTKGDNGATKDLGGAKQVKNDDGKTVMEIEVPSQKDIDNMWVASQAALRHKAPEEKQHRDAVTKQADHDRNSRTNVVLAWVGTNMVMILLFTSQIFLNFIATRFGRNSETTFNPYLTFLFWALAGLSFIRFLGTTFYLIFRLFGH